MTQDLLNKARLAWPDADVDETGFFYYQTGDNTRSENGKLCTDISMALGAVGLTLDDPYIEHDGIGGQLIPYNP